MASRSWSVPAAAVAAEGVAVAGWVGRPAPAGAAGTGAAEAGRAGAGAGAGEPQADSSRAAADPAAIVTRARRPAFVGRVGRGVSVLFTP